MSFAPLQPIPAFLYHEGSEEWAYFPIAAQDTGFVIERIDGVNHTELNMGPTLMRTIIGPDINDELEDGQLFVPTQVLEVAFELIEGTNAIDYLRENHVCPYCLGAIYDEPCGCAKRRWNMIRNYVRFRNLSLYIDKLAFIPVPRNLKRLYSEL